LARAAGEAVGAQRKIDPKSFHQQKLMAPAMFPVPLPNLLGLKRDREGLRNTCYSNAALQALLTISPLVVFCQASDEENGYYSGETPSSRVALAFIRYVKTVTNLMTREIEESVRKLVPSEVLICQREFMARLAELNVGTYGLNEEADSGDLMGTVLDCLASEYRPLSYLDHDERQMAHPVTSQLYLKAIVQTRHPVTGSLLRTEETIGNMMTVRADEDDAPHDFQGLLESYLETNHCQILRIKKYLIVDLPTHEDRETSVGEYFNFRQFLKQSRPRHDEIGSSSPVMAYRLTSSIVYNMGHYSCQVRHGNQWYYCNDGLIKRSNFSQTLCRNSRIFVWERMDPSPGQTLKQFIEISEDMEPLKSDDNHLLLEQFRQGILSCSDKPSIYELLGDLLTDHPLEEELLKQFRQQTTGRLTRQKMIDILETILLQGDPQAER
jgi:hypothetical protein